MKRILLVNPSTESKYCYPVGSWTDRLIVCFVRKTWQRRFRLSPSGWCTSVPPVTLFALKALFDRHCRTIIVDEQVDAIDFDLDVDLVCLTATTPQIVRAREIASAFRARGVPTALGGIHATCLPDECAADFDTVCVGEAEAYVREMIHDLAAGRLKPLYRADGPVDMDQMPFYDYDVAAGKYLPFHTLSFSRGCIFGCEFCSVHSTQGRHRTRSVESVVRQIESVGVRDVYFADAALTANRREARRLLRALIPLKIRWLSCIPLNIARDEEMLDLVAESGCWMASIGFETLSATTLRAVGKRQNDVGEYRRVIRAFHQRGIAIEGNFVFGFDGDTEEVFDATAEFTIETGIDLPEFYVLTPYPGTPLHRRLSAAGRIVDHDWSHYDNAHFRHLPVFQPERMSRQALLDGCRRADRLTYTPRNVLRRLRNSRMFCPRMWAVNYLFMRRMRQTGGNDRSGGSGAH